MVEDELPFLNPELTASLWYFRQSTFRVNRERKKKVLFYLWGIPQRKNQKIYSCSNPLLVIYNNMSSTGVWSVLCTYGFYSYGLLVSFLIYQLQKQPPSKKQNNDTKMKVCKFQHLHTRTVHKFLSTHNTYWFNQIRDYKKTLLVLYSSS